MTPFFVCEPINNCFMLSKKFDEMVYRYDVTVVDEESVSVKQRVGYSIDMLTPMKSYQEES